MRRLCHGLLLLASTGCFTEFEDAAYVIDAPQVLAIRGVPAEAPPNTPVHYEALVASPDGTANIVTQFAYCTQARTAEERTGVSASCLAGENLVAIEAESVVPADACARFGPNTPPSEAGEPGRRPSDPDPTGGYYLPIRASVLPDEVTQSFGLQRIRCDLAGATRAIFEAYQERYRNNRHPVIAGITILGGGDATQLGEDEVSWPAGSEAALSVEVRADSFEDYVVYSANDSALFDRTEALTVNWYVSGGELETARQSIDVASRSAQTRWQLPDEFATVSLWVVVRDSRGGTTWAQYVISPSATTPTR